MRQKFYSTQALILFSLTLVLNAAALSAAQNSSNYNDPQRSGMQSPNLGELRLAVNNHESEIRVIEEKFSSVESIVEELRRQFNQASKANEKLIETSKTFLEGKISNLELVTKGLIADLQLIKNHINESADTLPTYKMQLQAVEKSVAQQNQNIENLHAAVKAMMEVLQPGSEKDLDGLTYNAYQVKSGDSLEKIAQTQGTTVKALKEANNLTTDRIKIGQKLKLPTK